VVVIVGVFDETEGGRKRGGGVRVGDSAELAGRAESSR
jgi:hypothetical protein